MCAERKEVIKGSPAGAHLRWECFSFLRVYKREEKSEINWGTHPRLVPLGSPTGRDSNQTVRVQSRKNNVMHRGDENVKVWASVCVCCFWRLKVTVITLPKPARLPQSVSNQSCSARRSAPVISECVCTSDALFGSLSYLYSHLKSKKKGKKHLHFAVFFPTA